MRVAAYLLVAGVLFVAAIAGFAPATLVDARVATLSEGQLRIADARGTVWNGRGVLTDARGAWQMPLTWRLSPLALARGVVEVELAPVAGTMPTGLIRIDGGGVSLARFSAEIPAQALAALLPAREAIALGGTIALSMPAFSFAGTRGSGTIAANWRHARVRTGGRALDLGAVNLALAAQDTRLSGRIGNSGGDVRLDGTATIAANSLTIDGTLTPAPDAPADVARLLAALGPADGNGAVRVAYRGNLR